VQLLSSKVWVGACGPSRLNVIIKGQHIRSRLIFTNAMSRKVGSIGFMSFLRFP
jgi:hypothetical protein